MQTVEIPSMKVTKKVKSIQIFKKAVNSAIQVFSTVVYIFTYLSSGCIKLS